MNKLFEKDKVAHFVTCAILVLAITSVLQIWIPSDRALSFAGIITFLIGILKEVFDKYIRKTGFDKLDMVADIMGIMIMSFILAIAIS